MKMNRFGFLFLTGSIFFLSTSLSAQNYYYNYNNDNLNYNNGYGSYDEDDYYSTRKDSSLGNSLSSNVQGPFSLQSGKSFSTYLFANEQFASQQFLYTVSQEALGLSFSFHGGTAGIKLEIGFGYDPYSQQALGQRYEIFSRDKAITFDMSRFKYNGYQAGTVLLTVSLGKANETNDFSNDIPFTLTVSNMKMPSASILSESRPASFILNESNHYIASYQMTVQNDKKPVLFTWHADEGEPLLLLRFGAPAWTIGEADYYFNLNPIQQELFLDGEQKPLNRGVWYISILSQNQTEARGTVSFETAGQGGVQLKTLTSLPNLSGNDYENCMSALVGVTTAYGNFSGAFVSSKGHILTGLSAIKDPSGRILTDINIMVTTNVQEQPIYAFKASMIKSYESKDLALLQLTKMAMNRPVPNGMKFPYVQIAKGLTVEIGQPILIAGFPLDRIRGEVSSPFIFQNIVGGFEKRSSATWFKSTAVPGGMGGIAFNVYYELVGVSSPVKRAGSNLVDFFVTVSDIPSDWFSLIGN